jgi:hypothetical protein
MLRVRNGCVESVYLEGGLALVPGCSVHVSNGGDRASIKTALGNETRPCSAAAC